ncbi:MAG: mechanosensitive ion channel [Deltaproteobacteria bacterium]|nr:mechanosensitive ion channel [Deltaproteobacteria bacterium]
MDDPGNILQFVRVSGLVTAVVILAVTWGASHLVRRTFERVGDRFPDRRLLLQQIGTFTRFLLYILGFIASILAIFKFTDQMFLALGGTIAVTVGFAFKDLAASVIAGMTILVDRPFQVGDRVSFGGFYGEITSIGLRSVRLTTLDDNLVTIPNNKFLTDAVSSGNAGALDMLIQMDFYIGIDQDLARAKQVVTDAITSSRYAFLEKPWAVLSNQVIQGGYFALRVRAKVYVLDVRYEKALESEVTERVTLGFKSAGILPPAMLVRSLDGAPLVPPPPPA